MSVPEAPDLLPDERRERVLRAVRRHGTVRVNDLAQMLGVAAITVRRDIALLARRGLLRRVHGGATLPHDESATGTSADHSQRAHGEPPADAAIEDPGTSPGRASRSLTLGMVVPSLDYYWPDVIRGVREAAAGSSARVVLRGATYEAADERQQLTRLVEAVGVDGLLVAPTTTGPEGEELVRWLETSAVPIVLVERAATVGPYGEAMESVVSDHVNGAAMAVRHLAGLGHQRVGLTATAGSPTTPHVRRGWQKACDELHLRLDGVPDLRTMDHRDPSWPDTVNEIIDACLASSTTALLVHSDPEAISVVERCQERGIDVPTDLAVVAYDDQVAALCDPPLTAVRPHREAIGRAAVSLLTARLHDSTGDRPAHSVVVGPQLIVRDSSVPAGG
ncbi:DeoR family transcriptional regulator [Actinobacteria bacterium YIM 96077]|uniref:DNA-binding transcriptional regulator n=1 Tax=Phytoactinopolyspora halophila TaxID=1981511 RepID=A0A329QVA6_9ACTN|nr:substrate-binding domain-containing protein [Phytoactinopolyspora halophila]AYY13889.1 DeoR family transcriptional regulator [Actinobacteria bacterium YIM 96077]RAW15569.1 DNA-binding transcriptional regulator [Phytoactinopolyspora halophila]